MALTTEIAPGRARFFYVLGDRKSLHMVVKDFGTITAALESLDFVFNHDGIIGTGWYRIAFTEEDLIEVLGALDALDAPLTIEANLLRLYWQQRPARD